MQPGPIGTARFTLYWAPELDDPLHRAGSAWLGRDAETGAALPQPDLPDIASVTADARHYGLHATLKPPFRLGRSWAELEASVETLAARVAPFALPSLAVVDLDGFLALRETAPCPPLQGLADAAVTALDACRAPPDAAELARRRAAGLTARQEALLVRWGYPYVLDAWTFHLTLTRRLTGPERAVFAPAAAAWLAVALAQPRTVRSVCLFSQRDRAAPFLIARRFPLTGRAI